MNKTRLYFHSLRELQKRAIFSKLTNLGVYLIASIAFILSTVLLFNKVSFLSVNRVLIDTNPFAMPSFGMAVLFAIYLALLSSLSIAREIDKGGAEMLFYGPVNESAYLLSEWLANFWLFLFFCIIASIWMGICSVSFNFPLTFRNFGLFFPFILMNGALSAISLLIAVAGGKMRNSLLYFLLFLFLVLGIQISDTVITNLVLVKAATAIDPLILLRNIVAGINRVVSLISPLSITQRLTQSFSVMTTNNGIHLYLLLGGEMIISLFTAILIFIRKGIKS